MLCRVVWSSHDYHFYQIDMVEGKTWSTAARHTSVVSATRWHRRVMYNFICHQIFHISFNQQHYLFHCTNASSCQCTATVLPPLLVWCKFCHAQNGEQNASVILVTPSTSKRCALGLRKPGKIQHLFRAFGLHRACLIGSSR